MVSRHHASERIVVTGGTGFVGRHVVHACREAGFEVAVCSRSSGVDLRDGEAFGDWLWTVSPKFVVHCAAHVGGIGYVGQHAVDVFHDNLAIGAGLMRGLKIAGVDAVVTAMPNCTYPGDKEIYREDEWWDGPLHDSVLMYGLPRKTLWGLCKTYGDAYGLQSAHLILPNLYGPGDHFDPLRSHALGALVRKMVDAARDGESTVEVWGSGKAVREWMYVADAAEAVAGFLSKVHAVPSVMESHPIFNVGLGKGVSILELAELIRDAAGWSGRFVLDRSRSEGASQKLLDGERFHALTGWSPGVELREGIRQTVQWYNERAESEAAYARA